MERSNERLQGMAVGALLVLAGGLVAGRGPAVAEAQFQAGSAPVGMVACPDDGFVVVTGANGRYFHINERGIVRAIATDAGEFIDWK